MKKDDISRHLAFRYVDPSSDVLEIRTNEDETGYTVKITATDEELIIDLVSVSALGALRHWLDLVDPQ